MEPHGAAHGSHRRAADRGGRATGAARWERRCGAATFALVLSSPLRRARETARLAGFEPELRDDLAEWDYGEYDGLTTPEIREQVPDWTIWRYGALGGESVEQLAARADRVVAELLGVDGDVLVFSHGHFLRVLTARWLELWRRGRAGCSRSTPGRSARSASSASSA